MTDSQGEIFVQFTLVEFTCSMWLALPPAVLETVSGSQVLPVRTASQMPLRNRKRF
jgi:hypothetical protein